MLNVVRDSFRNWGWLVVTVLPLAQVIGRAAFTIVGVIYLAWAAIGLPWRRVRIDHRFLAFYVLLLSAFLLSISVASNRQAGFDAWINFVLYSSVSIVMAARFGMEGFDCGRFIKCLGVVGIVTVIVAWVIYGMQYRQDGFLPQRQMREDNLPLLTPFMLYALLTSHGRQSRWWTAGVVVVAVIAYIVISRGRAALIGLVIALGAYALMVLRARLRWALFAAFLMVAAAVAVGGKSFVRGAHEESSIVEMIDMASSYRTAIWRQAIESPPGNLWLGVGMGNMGNIPVYRMDDRYVGTVRHLHNFILDCWYQTGFVGLLALAGWLGYLAWFALKGWRDSEPMVSAQIGTLLSGGAAVVGAALLSFSFDSKQFACYLFMFLCLAAHVGQQAKPKTHTAARRAG
jgi:O-antigen ligase